MAQLAIWRLSAIWSQRTTEVQAQGFAEGTERLPVSNGESCLTLLGALHRCAAGS